MSSEEIKMLIKSQELILKKFDSLEKRIKYLEQKPTTIERKIEAQGFNVIDLLSLPDHLRETMIATIGLGGATAEDIASKTGRVRNLESAYLNQLVRLGHLKKIRKGRRIYFKHSVIEKPLINIINKMK